MVQNGQVEALQGNIPKSKLDKPIYKDTNKASRIQKQDKKEILIPKILSKTELRRFEAMDKHVLDKIFSFCTAYDDESPIPRNITHRQLHDEVHWRISAVGPRFPNIVVTNNAIDWSQCGPWVLSFSGHTVKIGHRYLADFGEAPHESIIHKHKLI
eukprot:5009693-Lingulodinium_polyedra.AAC.1